MIDLDALRVADVVREMAATRPAHPRHPPPRRTLTYAQLDERSNRLAQALLAAGAGPGSRVAHLDRSAPEVVELLAAAAKIGAVAVPLNWRLAAPELTAIVTDAGAPVMLAGPEFLDVASEVAARVPQDLRVVAVGDDYEAWLAAVGAGRPGRARRSRRSRTADVHVRHDRRPEGRADDAPQPGGGVPASSRSGRSTRTPSR